MKLLFDQNLSHRLVALLADVFPESSHVRVLGLAESDDLAIWQYAASHDFSIVTQDSDYSDWYKLRDAPPKIVWLRCGNASTNIIHLKLRLAAMQIRLMADQTEAGIVEIW